MYWITCDDLLLYHPGEKDHQLIEAQLHLELNTSGTLKLTIPKENVLYGKVQLMKSIIKVYEDGRLLFRGRPYAPTIDLYQNDTIECEGELAFFNDSFQEPFIYESGDVQHLFAEVIQKHNAQMPPEKQFHIGEITVSNNTSVGNIHRSSIEYLTTWNFLQDKFIKPLGGYLWLRYDGDKTYLDYLKELNFLGEQEVSQGINLIDAKKEVSSDQLATVVIPLGAKLKNADGEQTDEYLTLKALTGKVTLEDEKGLEVYGPIIKVVHHDHITDAMHLLKAGQRDLADSLGVTTTFTLSAADLSKAGMKVSPFALGTMIPVKVANLGVEQKMLIRSISIDLFHPESNHLTIGSSKRSLVADRLSIKESFQVMNQQLSNTIKESANVSVVKAVRQANSNINQTAELIRSEVSDGYYNKEKSDELLESIKTIISQTAGSIELTFNQYKKEQANINGHTSARFAEITKYIRFVDGDILLGEEGNPLTLRIENDRINFMENGASSAYWQNRKFYAVDGEFINSLKLGKFAFIPRQTGNLSFTKVVD